MADMPDRPTPDMAPPAPADAVQYRRLTAAQVAAELAQDAGAFGRAKQGYERAKEVSRETLEATVCL